MVQGDKQKNGSKSANRCCKIKDMQRLKGLCDPYQEPPSPQIKGSRSCIGLPHCAKTSMYLITSKEKKATTLANPTMANKLKKTNYANLDPESCKVNKQLFNELFYNIVFLLLRYRGLLSLQLL